MYICMCIYACTYVHIDYVIQIHKDITKMENRKTLHKP